MLVGGGRTFCLAGIYGIGRFRDYVVKFPPHASHNPTAVIFLEDHLNDLSKMQSLIARKIEWNQVDGQLAGDLKSWLNQGLTCQSSDPRERQSFCLPWLGIRRIQHHAPIIPYQQTVGELLIEIATRIIAVDQKFRYTFCSIKTEPNRTVAISRSPVFQVRFLTVHINLREPGASPFALHHSGSRVPVVEDSTRLIAEGFNFDNLNSGIRIFLEVPP